MFILIEMNFTHFIHPIIIIGPLKKMLVAYCSFKKQAVFQSINY